MAQFDDKSVRRISRTVRGWERRNHGGGGKRGRWQGHGVNYRIYTCELTENLLPGDTATATLRIGTTKTTDGDSIIVFDTPTSITAGKMIAEGTVCRVFKDPDMNLAANEYAFLLPFTCEVDQVGS